MISEQSFDPPELWVIKVINTSFYSIECLTLVINREKIMVTKKYACQIKIKQAVQSGGIKMRHEPTKTQIQAEDVKKISPRVCRPYIASPVSDPPLGLLR